MKAMGTMVKGFDVPVCNSFKAKVINDQLCYEVDLKRFKEEGNIENQLKHGLILLLDLNEDKQTFGVEMKVDDQTDFFLKEKDNNIQIQLDTICIMPSIE